MHDCHHNAYSLLCFSNSYTGGGGVTTATVTGLHPGWQYGFRVRAYNGNGAGQFGSIATVRLLDPIPAQPPPPKIVERKEDAIHATYVAGPVNGAVIANYELAMTQVRVLALFHVAFLFIFCVVETGV